MEKKNKLTMNWTNLVSLINIQILSLHCKVRQNYFFFFLSFRYINIRKMYMESLNIDNKK